MTEIIASFAKPYDDGEGFVVGHEAAISTYPGEGALDHPSPPRDLELACLVGAFDDFDLDRLIGERGFKLGPDSRRRRRPL